LGRKGGALPRGGLLRNKFFKEVREGTGREFSPTRKKNAFPMRKRTFVHKKEERKILNLKEETTELPLQGEKV